MKEIVRGMPKPKPRPRARVGGPLVSVFVVEAVVESCAAVAVTDPVSGNTTVVVADVESCVVRSGVALAELSKPPTYVRIFAVVNTLPASPSTSKAKSSIPQHVVL
jgi:hypothetical protein